MLLMMMMLLMLLMILFILMVLLNYIMLCSVAIVANDDRIAQAHINSCTKAVPRQHITNFSCAAADIDGLKSD